MSVSITGPPLISPYMMLSMGDERADLDESKIVVPGQCVSDAPQHFMRGHGTHTRDGEIVASVSGVVTQLNKLIMVKTIKQRYGGEVGDVVVARIVEVQASRWKCDVASRLHANLPLGAVLLPGGELRRKDVDDEERMAEFLKKGDLIAAEVQTVQHDGSVVIHTRNNKYGKLTQGIFVKVSSHLIKKQKKHFHTLPYGCALIIGCNGFVWITAALPETTIEDETGSHVAQWQTIPLDVRQSMCRVSSVIRLLAQYNIAIFLNSVTTAYELSAVYETKELAEQEVSAKLAYAITTRLLEEERLAQKQKQK